MNVDVANLSAEQKGIDRVVRAHDEECAGFKLNKFEDRGAGCYFLIYERTPQFHDWWEVTKKVEGESTSYSLKKVPHMG